MEKKQTNVPRRYFLKSTLQYLYIIGVLLLISFTNIQCGGKDGPPGDGPEPAEPTVPITPDPGMDLYGLLRDEHGQPVSNVVVSDGFSCTTTDEDGVYQMKKNPRATHVHYSIPSDYTVQTASENLKMANFFQAIRTATERYDFTLRSLPTVEKDFTLLGIADPQARTDGQVQRFESETMADVRALVSNTSGPVYGLALGDIMNDLEEFGLPLRRALGSGNIPMFAAIGNHDKFATADNPLRNDTFYKTVFGPTNYSFNRGDVHFICLDNVIFTEEGMPGNYVAGFTADQVEWLKQDLSYVSKDKMIILYYHIPLRNTNRAYRNDILRLLEGYAEVHLMAGHTHYNENFQVTNGIQAYEHIHGAACGAWWVSVINGDGTPNGYGVYHISGNTITDWYYKSTRFERNHQMRLHRGPARFGGNLGEYSFGLPADYIVANIWNADPDWTVAVYEDGVKTGEMQRSSLERCYWAQGYHIGVQGRVTYTQVARHIFEYQLQNPNADVEVVATDRFGNEYTETEFTTDVETAGAYF